MPLYTSFPKKEYELARAEIHAAMDRVLESGIYVLGQEVKSFEEEFARFIGTEHSVSLGNGTDALFLALKTLGIGNGDEVITTPLTAAFTSLAIVATGARPVFVDINKDTYNIDENLIEAAITPRTKAIMPVHLFGQPANIEVITQIAEKHHIPVIEDACQAHGASYRGKKVGTFGTIGCFSFYPTKNLGAIGDGGAITTNDKKIADDMAILKIGGQTKKYYHIKPGYNSRLDELQAAILRVKLAKLNQWITLRRNIATQYDSDIINPLIIKPKRLENAEHVFHLYVIRVANTKRDALQKKLMENDIHTQVHYPWPLHQLPAFTTEQKYSLPNAEEASQNILSLPIYPGLSETEVSRIIGVINGFRG